jgi:hypothetical protein
VIAMTSRKTNSSRKLSFQTLENRQLMAGNVAASVQNHNLVLTGDQQDNNIQVAQVGQSDYLITGLNGTKVNGHSSQTFHSVTGDVNANFKDGNDTLTFGTGTAGESTGAAVILPRNLTVNMGNGTNQFALYATSVRGKFSLTGGNGSDSAVFAESNIGISSVNSGKNDATINLGGGSNTLTMNYTQVERDLNILDQASNGDNLALNGGNVGRYLYAETGNGADKVQLDEMEIGSLFSLKTNGGNDTVILGGYDNTNTSNTRTPQGIFADHVFVDLGAGDDFLQFGGAYREAYLATGGVHSQQAEYHGGTGQNTIDMCVDGGFATVEPVADGFATYEFGYFTPMALHLTGHANSIS